MANNKLVVDERQADIGQFLVGRLLPFRKKRQVGPFTFIDHMGPTAIGPGRYMDVDQHPHIGLSTLTYLFEGKIAHRDSTGAEQVIHPGDVGFMTAGKGVTHTERSPLELRDGGTYGMHGYQIWVALPKDKEEVEPSFQYLPANELPQWEADGLSFTLVAGRGYGRLSPLQVYSDLFMLRIESPEERCIKINGELEGEIAMVVVAGSIREQDTNIQAGQMLISKTENVCHINVSAQTTLLLFGGQPLEHEPFLRWNFVSASKDKLKQAQQDWEGRKFPKVPGDDTYIPFPPKRK